MASLIRSTHFHCLAGPPSESAESRPTPTNQRKWCNFSSTLYYNFFYWKAVANEYGFAPSQRPVHRYNKPNLHITVPCSLLHTIFVLQELFDVKITQIDFNRPPMVDTIINFSFSVLSGLQYSIMLSYIAQRWTKLPFLSIKTASSNSLSDGILER